jgi:hypothetical protein
MDHRFTHPTAPDPDFAHALDEAWLGLWVAQGLAQLAEYLSKQAAYAAYCRAHHRDP